MHFIIINTLPKSPCVLEGREKQLVVYRFNSYPSGSQLEVGLERIRKHSLFSQLAIVCFNSKYESLSAHIAMSQSCVGRMYFSSFLSVNLQYKVCPCFLVLILSMQMLLTGEKAVIRATHPILQLIKKVLGKKMAMLHQQNKPMARRQQRRGIRGYHKSRSPS